MDIFYSKESMERLALAKRWDKVLRTSFNGAKEIEAPHGKFQEKDYHAAACSYFEYENAIKFLVGDKMLDVVNENTYKLSYKGWSFMATIENFGYEFLLRKELKKSLNNKIILWTSIIAAIGTIITIISTNKS